VSWEVAPLIVPTIILTVKRSLSLFLLVLLVALLPSVGVAGGRVGSDVDSFLPGFSADLLPVWASESPSGPLPPSRLDPALARLLAQARPDRSIPVIVELRAQVDPEEIVRAAPSPAAAQARLVAGLQALAERTQAPLRAYLEGARAAGRVASYRPFWIFNGIAVRARPQVVRTLAAHPAVALVRLDRYRRWVTAPEEAVETPVGVLQSTEVEWNVARIRADEVWNTFQISGTGTVVAGMDTGVDWLHPALQANYRGYNPHGAHNHTGNWFDAVNGTLYPTDDHGHGTHTLGTAVGRGGIGVAPGARWIGVKVLDRNGYGYDSWIHAGFQWLLAPAGDPALAPDVVNCSWGNDNGYLTTFQADLRALRAAGILAVFASGNAGPGEGTVGSPASLPEAFAVGATDEQDQVAYFSGRGPSPWGEVRPHVVAPGVHVRSSLPGGRYGLSNGTSMAAPHVSGLAALLRSVSPTLSITRAAFVITSTAVPLGDPIPNNDTGWGRVDGFAAVAALAHPGFVSGTVRSTTGTPVGGATVVATDRGGGGGGRTTADDAGRYRLVLPPSTYDLTGSAFGYVSGTVWGVSVVTGATTVVDLALTPLPTGTLRVSVTDGATGGPLTATVGVLDTPLEATGSAVTFSLPAGNYVVQARRLGYRVVTATAAITVGGAATVAFSLPPAPTILLVDSGRWYYGSQIGYFRQALDDLAYTYDEWPIDLLPDDLPEAEDLAPYDIVIWSAPWDAPGYIGADGALSEYLLGGGRLLLTGQDIGYLDGGGLGFRPYYQDLLKVYLVQDNSRVWTVEGVPGDLFSGLTVAISGTGGADNQVYPDEIGIFDEDSVAPVWAYRGDGCAGVRVGTCLNYRVVYLSFGFEAINDRGDRREVMERSLAWLTAEPPTAGLEWKPVAQASVGPPGSSITYALRLRHLGQAGVTDTVTLTLEGASWPAWVSAPRLTLSPCASATVVITVAVPPTVGWDAQDVMTLTARSSISPGVVSTAVLTAKAPAPVLLVDDDRWYEQSAKYRAALEAAGIPYDFWQTCPATGGCQEAGPLAERMAWYPVVLWWTGYDWYRPVTSEQEEALKEYLEGGGRLFLSSQDFLYHHAGGPFVRDFLGVLTYTEATTPLLAVGVPEDPIGDEMGPWDLDYPFPNWSDSVEPMPGVRVVLRDQNRRAIGLASRGGDWSAVFFPFPFEALPEAVRPAMMERIVGWLSWLGGSTFRADRGAVSPGEALTYTLCLRNGGFSTVTASLSNTIPVSLSLVSGTLTGPAGYDPAARRLAWEGPLPPGAGVTVTYRAVVSMGVPPGTTVVNPVRLGLEGQGIHFYRRAVVRVGAPDLSPSVLRLAPSPARPNTELAAVLTLTNAGPADATTATAVISLPANTALVSGSLGWSGGVAEALSGAVRWRGSVSASMQATVSWRLSLPSALSRVPFYSVAFVEDGVGGRWERPGWVWVVPWRLYLPVVRVHE